MSDKLYSLRFVFRPVQYVNYLVDHADGRTDQELSLCDSDDAVVYSFHVYASSADAAIAVGKLCLTDAVREDYHHDAFPRILTVYCKPDD